MKPDITTRRKKISAAKPGRPHKTPSVAALRASRLEQRRLRRRSLSALVLVAFGIAAVVDLAVLTASSEQVPGGTMSLQQRNDNVALALTDHPVTTLAGATSQLLTLQQQRGNIKQFIGLSTCPNQGSAQSALTAGYGRGSFAYLLSASPTQSPGAMCSEQVIAAAYGRPSAMTVIAGTVDKPSEALLFYDHGVQRPAAKRPPPFVLPSQNLAVYNAAVQQLAITGLPPTACPNHDTIVQVVAHEDDDLLFMNPDLLHSLQQGSCIRTVYLTAGDAGHDDYYWLGRERGAEAAYASLTGLADEWTNQTVRLGVQEYATVAELNANAQVSLLFFHLPDGGQGHGFGATGFESMAALLAGENSTLRTVDGQSTYTYGSLTAALEKVLTAYKPTELRTQLPYDYGGGSDHSDHKAAGKLASTAFLAYHVDAPAAKLTYYIGYPIRGMAPNVDGDDLSAKEQAFFAYAGFDRNVCSSMPECATHGDYGDYLVRQYHTDQ